MTAIAIVGNPADGLTFYGPFADAEEANLWCEDEQRRWPGPRVALDWWSGELHAPEDDDASTARVTTTDLAERLNWLHCLVQELENGGVELPMGDYTDAYGIIEDARETIGGGS